MMEQARQHLMAGEKEQAEALFRQILGENPDVAEALFLLAQVRQQQGDFEEPVQLLAKAEELEPFNPNILHAQGVLHINRKELDDAEKAFHKALEINPGHVAARNGLAFLDLAAGRFEAARHAAEQALSEEPENAQAMTYLGTALLELGEPSQAQAILQEALRLQPEALTAQAQLGRAFLATGNAAFAVQCFENALQTAPESADLLEFLGRAQLAMGEVQQALEPLRASMAKGRANAELFRALAACEVTVGNPGQSEGLLAAALSMEPGREDLVVPLAELLIARGATQGAIEHLEALKRDGVDAEPVDILLSRALRAQGESAAAVAAIQPRSNLEEASADVQLALIQALDADGRDEMAEEKLLALLAEEQPPLPARLYQAQRLFEKDDEAAIGLLEELAISHGLSRQQLVNIRRMLAEALHRAGRYPEAAGQYHAMAHRQAEILLIDAEFEEPEERVADGGGAPTEESSPTSGDPSQQTGNSSSNADSAYSAMQADATADWPTTPPNDGRDAPVFVISWPGSGHERVLPALSAHSGLTMVMDIGPTQAVRRATVDRPRGAKALGSLDDTQIQLRRSAYWKELKQLGVNPEGQQILDAMWLTVESLPTIARLFPQAKILCVQRDPRDMAVAWMMSGYRNIDVMAMTYKAQLQMLGLCRDALPLQWIDVNYDAADESPEAVLNEALAGLGLQPEDQVVSRFNEVPMPVAVRKGDYAHYRASASDDDQESPGSDSVH